MLTAGSRAPEIAAADLSGTARTLSGLLGENGGGPVLVAFFKISCPVCQLTFPFLQRFADHGVRVVGVSKDSQRATERFRDQFRLRFPLWLDPAEARYPASNAYGITSVPSLFLVNSAGTVEVAVSGFSRADMEALAGRFGFVPFSSGEAVPAFRPG